MIRGVERMPIDGVNLVVNWEETHA